MTQRIVMIPDIVLRTCILSYEELLRKHGIHPYYPYDHDTVVIAGGVVHRYTQPPRPLRLLTKEGS